MWFGLVSVKEMDIIIFVFKPHFRFLKQQTWGLSRWYVCCINLRTWFWSLRTHVKEWGWAQQCSRPCLWSQSQEGGNRRIPGVCGLTPPSIVACLFSLHEEVNLWLFRYKNDLNFKTLPCMMWNAPSANASGEKHDTFHCIHKGICREKKNLSLETLFCK